MGNLRAKRAGHKKGIGGYFKLSGSSMIMEILILSRPNRLFVLQKGFGKGKLRSDLWKIRDINFIISYKKYSSQVWKCPEFYQDIRMSTNLTNLSTILKDFQSTTVVTLLSPYQCAHAGAPFAKFKKNYFSECAAWYCSFQY